MTALTASSCSSSACGRSRPHAGAPRVNLSGNTTADLLADLELLRLHLEVDRCLVLGGAAGLAGTPACS